MLPWTVHRLGDGYPSLVFAALCVAMWVVYCSVMAESVIRSLSSVAACGAGVLTSLHSPTSAMAAFFTHVMVLTTDGRLAFHGPYSQIENYLLGSLGLQVPPHFSTVEFVLSLVARQHHNTDKEGEEEDELHLSKRMDKLERAFATSSLAVQHPLPPENA